MQAILSVSLILFTVIDIIGSLPVILDLRRQGVRIHPTTATLVAGFLMVSFLFFGTSALGIFGIDISSFALAGSLIIFFIGLEMTLGIRFFREEQSEASSGTLVPVAFPLIAGAGSLTTILSLKASYGTFSIMGGILLNLLFVWLVLRGAGQIEKRLGPQGMMTLRKIFGIILIAVAIQMFRTHWGA
ncbi:MAG: MarC family protein [Bacteroidota bacterium]